jgi:hypothetical protein
VSSVGDVSDAAVRNDFSNELIERKIRIGEIQSQIAVVEKELTALEAEFFDNPERGVQGGERHAALNVRLEVLNAELEKLKKK